MGILRVEFKKKSYGSGQLMGRPTMCEMPYPKLPKSIVQAR